MNSKRIEAVLIGTSIGAMIIVAVVTGTGVYSIIIAGAGLLLLTLVRTSRRRGER